MQNCLEKSGGKFYEPGHHESHAANAFFSSNFDDALIITIDGGGRDYDKDGNVIITTFTIWRGEGNKIFPVMILPDSEINIGEMWNVCTEHIFGLSVGHPIGNQAGSVMAMAVMGNPNKYYGHFAYRKGSKGKFTPDTFDWQKLRKIASSSEEGRFDVAASLQKITEEIVKNIIQKYVYKYKPKNICLSGGVVLNSVMTGKMLNWFDGIVENFYVCPVPYDAGLAIGAAQWVYHQKLNMPRVLWEGNCTPYLGELYSREQILTELNNFTDSVEFSDTTDSEVLDLLSDKKIVSIFHAGSESGRRALGNRSILADPRHHDMKDLINEKVKHRQWYRPFAPSILKEDVKDWFVRDIDSPYMSYVIQFKEEVKSKVPAVTHLDGSGRLQTVTEKDNPWFYGFLKKWKEKTNVPILLNTSFNDREPIVETPKDAIKCFYGTEIDYLYFCDEQILVKKRK
jgi:carbamoyltransferase